MEYFIPEFTTNEYMETYEQWAYYMEQRHAFNNAISLKNKVKQRDNYACKHCGRSEGITLHIHHKNGCRAFPEQALKMENLVTLCHECHHEFHKMYGFGQTSIVTEEQFEEWQLLACGISPEELPSGGLLPKNRSFEGYLPTEEELEQKRKELEDGVNMSNEDVQCKLKEMKKKEMEKLEELKKQAEQYRLIHEMEEIEEKRKKEERKKEREQWKKKFGLHLKEKSTLKCAICGKNITGEEREYNAYWGNICKEGCKKRFDEKQVKKETIVNKAPTKKEKPVKEKSPKLYDDVFLTEKQKAKKYQSIEEEQIRILEKELGL